MRLLALSHLKPGMRVARTVMDAKGRVLLHTGVPLTEDYIRALRSKGYSRLLVKDPEAEVDVELEEDVSPEVRARASAALHETFVAIEDELASLKGESQQSIIDAMDSEGIRDLMGRDGPLAQVQSIINTLMEDVLNRKTLAGLTSIKGGDSAIFDHSIDVCAAALMIGHIIGMDYHRLRQLATGTLLHDIGKIFLDRGMTRRRMIVQHTRLGYELLKSSDQRDILSPHVAYEHHEHQDGTGLPRGLRGSNVLERDRGLPPPIPTLVGEIAAVANEFDNLLTGSSGARPVPTDQALLRIRRDAGTRFNKAVVTALLRVTPVYPVGVPIVVVSERYRKYQGVVVRVNQNRLDRPVIALTHDRSAARIKPIEIDLKQEEEIAIKSRL